MEILGCCDDDDDDDDVDDDASGCGCGGGGATAVAGADFNAAESNFVASRAIEPIRSSPNLTTTANAGTTAA